MFGTFNSLATGKELVLLHKVIGNPFLTRLVFHILVQHTKVTICLTPLLTKVLIFHWSCFYAHVMHRVLRTKSSWYCILVPCLLLGLWHNPLRWRSQFVFVDAMKIWGWHDSYISCTFGEASSYSFLCLGLNELLESHVGPSPHERMTKYIYSKFGNPFNVFIICPISILQIWLGENCSDTHLTIFFFKVIKVLFEFTR